MHIISRGLGGQFIGRLQLTYHILGVGRWDEGEGGTGERDGLYIVKWMTLLNPWFDLGIK